MANELTISSGILGTKGYLEINEDPGSQSVTMTGTRDSSGVQDIGTIFELLTVDADLGTVGWGWYRNLSASTNITLAVPAPQLTSPAAPTVTPFGTTGSTTYSYRIAATDAAGATLASTAGTTSTGNATLSGTNYNTVTWTAVTGASGYKVYGRTSGSELLMATLGQVLTWNDTGTVTPAGALPGGNTTGFQDFGLIFPTEHFPIPLSRKDIWAKAASGTAQLKKHYIER